jgi:hypothetical protein
MSAHAYDAYTSIHSAQPLDVMPKWHHSLIDTFNVVTSQENQYSCGLDVFDLKYQPAKWYNNMFPIDPVSTNNQIKSYSKPWIDSTYTQTNESYESFSQGFIFPSLQAQGHTYKTVNSSRCDELIDWWTTLPPHEAPASASNALGCPITSPAVVDISDTLYGKIEHDDEFIHLENDIMIDNSSFTPSSVITNCNPCHSYSNVTDFTHVYPVAYIKAHNVEDYVAHQPCLPHSSLPQFSASAIPWADVDQYSDIQAEGQNDGKNHVNLRREEANYGKPTYINIHRQHSYQLPQIGEL